MLLVECSIDGHSTLAQFVDLPYQCHNPGRSQPGSPGGDRLTHPPHHLTISIRGLNTNLFFEDTSAFLVVTVCVGNLCVCVCVCV